MLASLLLYKKCGEVQNKRTLHVTPAPHSLEGLCCLSTQRISCKHSLNPYCVIIVVDPHWKLILQVGLNYSLQHLFLLSSSCTILLLAFLIKVSSLKRDNSVYVLWLHVLVVNCSTRHIEVLFKRHAWRKTIWSLGPLHRCHCSCVCSLSGWIQTLPTAATSGHCISSNGRSFSIVIAGKLRSRSLTAMKTVDLTVYRDVLEPRYYQITSLEESCLSA